MRPLRLLASSASTSACLRIAEYLHETLGPRFEVPALLRDMVNAGTLGKKSGQGFHRWE